MKEDEHFGSYVTYQHDLSMAFTYSETLSIFFLSLPYVWGRETNSTSYMRVTLASIYEIKLVKGEKACPKLS
ncbi:hypothetical protein JOD43_003479 [Pullulanibacillus pueri]|nr:hypothetical protein [Pullulanibacillus pueri]